MIVCPALVWGFFLNVCLKLCLPSGSASLLFGFHSCKFTEFKFLSFFFFIFLYLNKATQPKSGTQATLWQPSCFFPPCVKSICVLPFWSSLLCGTKSPDTKHISEWWHLYRGAPRITQIFLVNAVSAVLYLPRSKIIRSWSWLLSCRSGSWIHYCFHVKSQTFSFSSSWWPWMMLDGVVRLAVFQ